MSHFTSNTYQIKREILSFSNKISKHLSLPDRKFCADMLYGMLASKSCLLTDIVDQLHEPFKKVNSVEHLARHLSKGTPLKAVKTYLAAVRRWAPDEPVILIDDSDIVKPDGYHFEALGFVRDGSKSTSSKTVFEKGYHVTEACVLARNGHPFSIFSQIHSSKEKHFTSINDVTFHAIERGTALFHKATFVMDRGYKIFLKLDELKQDYIIRLTAKRKLFFHGKWIPAAQLRNRRKGKVKLPLYYKGKQHQAYLSHVKVQITASREEIYLILVYGITEHPMMLATNKKIRSKGDLLKAAGPYFSRWRIEEYFRCKKQVFRFENFRVRRLASINALNFYAALCMAFLTHMSMKPETSALKASIMQRADPIKGKVHFCYYRLAKGICSLLSYASRASGSGSARSVRFTGSLVLI